MRQLVLTKIDPIPNECQADHLGPWSLSDAQFFDWRWEKYGIRRVLQAEDIWPVARSLEKVCEFYLHSLSRRQNERHGRSYSRRYWRILLTPWLLGLVMCSFHLFLRIRNRIIGGVPYLAYLSPCDEVLPSMTTAHFQRMLVADPLNRLISSRFLRTYEPKGWILRDGAPALGDGHPSAGARDRSSMRDSYAELRKSLTRQELFHWGSILSSNLGCVQFHGVYGLSLIDGLCISFRMLFRNRKRWKDAAKSFRKMPDAGNEDLTEDDVIGEIKSIQGVNADEAGIFLQVPAGLIEETMPEMFTDKFRESEKRALAKIKATAPWTDTISGGFHQDSWKFYLAGLLENRSVNLVGSQHGGNYGLIETAPWQNLVEYQTADRFVSWGWERQSDYPATAAPASSPLLSKMRRGRKRDSSIILIGPDLPVYPGGLLMTNYLPEDIPESMMGRARFIDNLEDELRAVLLYRPRITEATYRYDRAYMGKKYPEIKFLTGKIVRRMWSRLLPVLSRCGVCVLDAPSTTAALTMAAGIPTVFFWNENVWLISRQAKPHVKKLSAVNVVHSSPESAARHLNSIWPDIDSWWENSRTREAVSEFANRYCRSNRNWRSEWVELFSSVDSELWKSNPERH